MALKLEKYSMNGIYCRKDAELNSEMKKEEEKVYTYDEAINLTGNGWYNVGLLMTLGLAILSMSLDMFGFNYVVAAGRCDLQLSHSQTSFLLSVPLMGSMVSAYIHGYLSDTRGRKKCITCALWGSFLLASLSAMAPNFITLVILKFFCCSISSGLHSMGYTLMGESSSARIKERYVMILSGVLMCCLSIFTVHAYLVLALDFSYDLGFIIFKPWRLLILTLALGLGISAIFMEFFYESPKYLVSVGRTPEAVEILKKIRKRNGLTGIYHVKNIILLDTCSAQSEEVSFLRSLWGQIAPLFKPPLLQKTLLLFYILANLFSLNSGLFIWIPIIFKTYFDEPPAGNANVTGSFCDIIKGQSVEKSDDCTSVVNLETLVMTLIQSLTFFTLNFGATRLAHRKKFVIISLTAFTSICCIAMLFVTEKYTTIVLFFGAQLNCIAMGMNFCYIIELYPTCYRGMITSLGVMVARGSGLVGVSLVGAFMFTNCTTSLYSWGAYAFSGTLMAFFLPPDMPKKS